MKVDKELVLKIISKALNIPQQKITEKTKLASFEEWDSLGMLTVMSAIDKKIKGKVDINSFEKVKNIEDIVKIINKK
jgi:acyl carrier protein